jgi:hypothetical protein
MIFFGTYTVQRSPTPPHEHTYVNPTSMSTSKGLSTRSRDSRSHLWCLILDWNAAYHLTHNACKS